jgi:putative FmdB family regulatory protein
MVRQPFTGVASYTDKESTEEAAMPVYEFFCRDCKKPFEVVLSVAEYDPHKVECPGCGGKKVERRWSSVTAITSRKS